MKIIAIQFFFALFTFALANASESGQGEVVDHVGINSLRGTNAQEQGNRDLGKDRQEGTSDKKSCMYYYMKEQCSGFLGTGGCSYVWYEQYMYCVEPERDHGFRYVTNLGKGEADTQFWNNDYLKFYGLCDKDKSCSERVAPNDPSATCTDQSKGDWNPNWKAYKCSK